MITTINFDGKMQRGVCNTYLSHCTTKRVTRRKNSAVGKQ